MPTTIEAYEYYAKHLKKDPAKVIKSGASSDEYAKRVNEKVLTVVCEVPYIYDDRVANTTPIGIKRRDVILLGIRKSRKLLKELQKRLSEAEPLVNMESPFYESLSEFLRLGLEHLKAEENWAKKDPSTDRQATVSEAFDSIAARVYFYG
ncbi:MAG: peptidase M14, partial [Candidatus Methanomethylicota archaeon]